MQTVNWQELAKESGLSQRRLARLMGYRESSLSRAMQANGGPPQHVRTLILAWRTMTADQRASVESALDPEKPKAQAQAQGR